jgi:hypothetical protein
MKNKKIEEILNNLVEFQKKLEKKPSFSEMFSQLKMMRFKLRPLAGDFINTNFNNKEFIEALWVLGKLDEFFNENISKLKRSEDKEKFFNFFNQIFIQYQEKLNRVSLKQDEKNPSPSIVEVEIFKELKNKKN